MSSQIGGAGHQDLAHGPEFDRDQAAIGEVADAHGDVDAFVHQQDIAIRQGQPHREGAVVGQHPVDDRQHMETAEAIGAATFKSPRGSAFSPRTFRSAPTMSSIICWQLSR